MNTNRTLLKEAMADAKDLKDAAVANAKIALEEAFTPQIKELFASKIEEMESEDSQDDNMNLEALLDELDNEDEVVNEADDKEEKEEKDEEDEDIEISDMSEEDLTSFIQDVINDMVESGELEAGEGEEIEAGEDEELPGGEEIESEIDTEVVDEEIDLKELLAEMEEMEKEEESTNEVALNAIPDAQAILAMLIPALGLGAAAAAVMKDEIIDAAKKGKDALAAKIKEVAAKIKGEQKDGEVKEAELAEAYKTIENIKTELHETNILNAKLLYANKIFKAKNLTDNQKVKVLESFDKASTVKEVKLVFETLTEGLKEKKSPVNESIKGFASKATGGIIKSNKQIIETNDVFTRMQKLAGIK